MPELFSGPTSVRVRSERTAFWLTILFAPLGAFIVGGLIHEELGVSQVALLIVFVMIYVTLARGRLIGSSVRIHEQQFPEIFSIVKRCAAMLQVPMPAVFLREDIFVPIVAVGFGDPYTLVLSSNWIEHFKEDELTFMIGRELGHIASGHTRFSSLLSVSGHENPLVAFIFGPWLRRCDLTCDRIGLLCCGSLDAATRAIAIATFHHLGRSIDHAAFAEQRGELVGNQVLQMGEWLGAAPYATTRIESMRQFLHSQLYAIHEESFVHHTPTQPPALVQSGTATVQSKDCAGWTRRFAAFAIDFILVAAIAINLTHIHVDKGTSKMRAVAGSASIISSKGERALPILNLLNGIKVEADGQEIGLGDLLAIRLAASVLSLFWISVYLALVVAITGQSFGMMIAGLRVVRTDFGRPGIAQTIWRYAIVLLLWWFILPLSFFSRIYLHDRISKTRLVKAERAVARPAERYSPA
ncbi:MAG: RDD family protein [Candidatus Eremiobacteraeota bacterium]|nr:RDD family protein [Candidatus Eremiobacteraeota bacterium]